MEAESFRGAAVERSRSPTSVHVTRSGSVQINMDAGAEGATERAGRAAFDARQAPARADHTLGGGGARHTGAAEARAYGGSGGGGGGGAARPPSPAAGRMQERLRKVQSEFELIRAQAAGGQRQ